jgi:hypothetical protein
VKIEVPRRVQQRQQWERQQVVAVKEGGSFGVESGDRMDEMMDVRNYAQKVLELALLQHQVPVQVPLSLNDKESGLE